MADMFALCRSCGHASAVHDVYDDEDPYPTCCTDGCKCGHPGEAVIQQADDGTLTVLHADPVIRVSNSLLDDMKASDSPQWDPSSLVLLLDTAGAYRYEYLRPDPTQPSVSIFGRVQA